MTAQEPDMFSSDLVFLRVVSGTLIAVGAGGLLVVFGGQLLGLDWTTWDWVPMFGGYDIYRRELAAINLPLAMLILGIGLRLYTPFGWATCMVLLVLLLAGFGLLSWRLSHELGGYWQMVAETPEVARQYPLVESIAVNLSLAVLVLAFIIYLLLPQVRRLFWQSSSIGPNGQGG